MLSKWNIIPAALIILLLIPFSTVFFNPNNNVMNFVDDDNEDDEDVFRIVSTATTVNKATATTAATTPPATAVRISRITTRASGILQRNATYNTIRRPTKRARNMTARRNEWHGVNMNRDTSTCVNVKDICQEEPQPLIPVCDNANRTHRSACSLARYSCEQIRLGHGHSRILVHVGPCNEQSPVFTYEEEVCPSECSRKYKPVCDSRQQTYPNLCTFQKYNCMERKNNEGNASFLYALSACNRSSSAVPTAESTDQQFQKMTAPQEQFECPKVRGCAGLRQPVCDSDGRWHRNQCTFLWARCMAARQGRQLSLVDGQSCARRSNRMRVRGRTDENGQKVKEDHDHPRVSAPRRCHRECPSGLAYQPICATSYVTYPNQCMFQNAKCHDKSLEQLFYGECRDCLSKTCRASTDDEPDSNFVCDQAGMTKSKCEFEMLRCIYERKFGYNITAAYIGRCCPSEDTCALPYDETSQQQQQQPVCDSRNVTHPNRCHFEVYKCRAEKIAHRRITLLNENGSCPVTPSGQSYITPQDEAAKCGATIECDTRYEPVCGTDGITYVNRCRLEKTKCHNKSLSIAYKGECCVTRCEQHWAPVCDNRNITHVNLCVFSLQSCVAARRDGQPLHITSYTACPGDDCNIRCEPKDYQPVCASNGVTYRNKCELDNTICELKRQRRSMLTGQIERTELELDYIGECCEDSTAKCDGGTNLTPLCDTEGHTHVNICEYERAACLSRKRFRTNLTIRYWGECCKDDCQNEPPGTPLCDNTQTTHDNWCKFRLAQCESHRRNGRTLQLAYMGECCRISREVKCSSSGPVCDSDAATHPDLCTFQYRQCVITRTQHRTISIAYYGECCSTHCSNEWIPVCDQQGTIYRNRCHFDARKCFLDRTNNTMLKLVECRQQQQPEILSNSTLSHTSR